MKQIKSLKQIYNPVFHRDFRQSANHLGTAMPARGWQGKLIAIIGKNRVEWMESYFAVLCGIGMCVPLERKLPWESS